MKDVTNNEYKLLSSKKMNEWKVGSPVQLVEYNLYYDYKYNRNFVNAIFSNVSDKCIKTIYVNVLCYDDANDLIGALESLPISDVCAMPEKHFGEDSDLILPYLNASSVEISVGKVVYDNGSSWKCENECQSVEIPEQTQITGDYELYDQLCRECEETGVTPVYFPIFTDKLWVCTCGTVNECDNGICHDCKAYKSWLEKHFSAEYLAKKNKTYNDEKQASELSARYEDAKVKHRSYSGYIEAAEKMEALGYYMDAPSLAKSYYAEAEKINAETVKKLNEEIYQSKKHIQSNSPEVLRAAASKLDEISGYKDSAKLAQEYRAKAYSIERNQRRAEKAQLVEKKKAEQRRRKIVKRTLVISLSSLLAAALICLVIFVVWPYYENVQKENLYNTAIEHIENGEFSEAIEILERLGTYNAADKKIKIIIEDLLGREDAIFATSKQYPCYSISDDGVLSFKSSEYKFTDGTAVIPDVFDNKIVLALADSFLKGSDWLEKVVIPYSVKNISTGAFSSCQKLKEVVLHEDLRVIGKSAFENCTSLKSIDIPDYVHTIEGYAFSGCTALESITLPGQIRAVNEYTFNRCSKLTSVEFKTDVERIGDYAFANCTALKTFDFSSKLESIGASAFAYCTAIKEISIFDSVKTIGNSAFIGCKVLESVTLGEGLTQLENRVFQGCTALTKLVIGSSVNKIKYEVFDGCNSLDEVTFKGSEDKWNQVSIGDKNTPLTNAQIKFS